MVFFIPYKNKYSVPRNFFHLILNNHINKYINEHQKNVYNYLRELKICELLLKTAIKTMNTLYCSTEVVQMHLFSK